MSELLLELFSEEIPARMQARAAEDLMRLVTEGLKARGLDTGEARCFSTPRRLTLVVADVPAKSPAVSEERKGPRVGAPEQAVHGFLKSAGLAKLSDAEIVKDEKKGDYYVAKIDKPGRPAAEIVAETVNEVLARFPWPKSMRWGSNPFQWVRPLQSILCLLGGRIVPGEAAGITFSDETRGHRFLGPQAIKVKDFAGYEAKLEKQFVILDPVKRIVSIAEQAKKLAKDAKLELVEDEALLAENAGLTEWPVVLMGSFDKEFLAVPGECLTTSMKTHQKCFSLRDPKTKKLANKFLLVSNLAATDGGAADHVGQREGHPRPAFGRQVLLGPGSEEAARRNGERAFGHHVPREARDAKGPRRARRGIGVTRSRALSTPIRKIPAAPRSFARLISFPAWSASSRSCKA